MTVSSSQRPEAIEEDDDDPFAEMDPAKSTKRRKKQPVYGTAPPTMHERPSYRPGQEDDDSAAWEPASWPRRDESQRMLLEAAAAGEGEVTPPPASGPRLAPTMPLSPSQLSAVQTPKPQSEPPPSEPPGPKSEPRLMATAAAGGAPEYGPAKPTVPDSLSAFGHGDPAAAPAVAAAKKVRAVAGGAKPLPARTQHLAPAMKRARASDAIAAPRVTPNAEPEPRLGFGLPALAWFGLGWLVGLGCALAGVWLFAG